MRIAGLAAGLLLAVPALAQEQEREQEPDAIIVTGRGLAAPPGDAAYDVVTIARDRIAGTASGRLEDALRDAAEIRRLERDNPAST